MYLFWKCALHYTDSHGNFFCIGNKAKAETPVLWPLHAKNWLIGKDSDAGRDCGQEEKGTTEDEMAGWHHWLDGRESQWTPGVGDGQGGLACCDSWGRRVGHDWVTELNWTECASISFCSLRTLRLSVKSWALNSKSSFFPSSYG